MKVLVIGLGSMGKRRIRLLNRFEEVDTIVGIDGRQDRREETKNTYCVETFESIEKAIETVKDISCAFICTSPLSHSGLIKTVLEKGLHVFTEINLVKDGYEENMALAKKKGKVLFLSSTFFYREEIQFIRGQVALAKETGKKINYIYHIGQYLPDWHPWENYKDFFVGDKRTNGCREIFAIEMPWLVGTFGNVKEYHVLTDNISGLNIDYKDNYMITIQHENGDKGTLIVDIVSPKAIRNLEVYGENFYCGWNGSPASLETFDAERKKIRNVKLHEDEEHMEGYGAFIVENAYVNEIKEFFDVVSGKKDAEYGFEQDLEVLELIDQIEGYI